MLLCVAVTALLATAYAYHTIEKQNAVAEARKGWVSQLEVQVLEQQLVRVKAQYKKEQAANVQFENARREAERELQTLEMELLTGETNPDLGSCLVSDSVFDWLRGSP